MQTTQRRPRPQVTNKYKFFRDRADQIRRQVLDVEVRIIFLENQERDYPNANCREQRRKQIVDLKSRARSLRSEMERALFNAGR